MGWIYSVQHQCRFFGTQRISKTARRQATLWTSVRKIVLRVHLSKNGQARVSVEDTATSSRAPSTSFMSSEQNIIVYMNDDSREYKLMIMMDIFIRAVPEFGSGSGSGRNPAFFTNPADIRLRPKLGRIWNFAGFLNNTNLNDLYIQNLFPTNYAWEPNT